MVNAWIGNSRKIAEKHYLQVTDNHFLHATQSGAESVAKAVQNPVQQPAVLARTVSQTIPAAHAKAPVLQELASDCDVVHECKVGDEGLEPPTSTV